jgi:GNAT superfamily N-acetyltransferase
LYDLVGCGLAGGMIDTLTPDDAAAAAALSACFGWPHRLEDWQAFLRIGRGVAWREAGALAGTAMWFPLDAGHASIGSVQVTPGLQGRGLGRRLMRAVMAAAGDRALLLHATTEGAGLYASLGFAPGGVVEQLQGIMAPPAAPRPSGAADHAAIKRLDHEATGLDRSPVLDALQPDAVAVSGPAATGYAMRRRFGRGALIGPLVAADEAEAMALVQTLWTPGFVRLDVEAGAPLAADLRSAGLVSAGTVRAMTLGAWPQPPGPARWFGLASQALG